MNITKNMNITKWLKKFIKRMKWYDISLIKLSVFFSTLFLITIWAGFRNLVLGVEWYWYLIISVILMIPIFKKMYFK